MAVSLTPALSQGEGEMERAARGFHRNTQPGKRLKPGITAVFSSSGATGVSCRVRL